MTNSTSDARPLRFSMVVLFVLIAAQTGCQRNREEMPPESSKETPRQPSVVVFRAADGRTITADELRGLTGTFQYEVVGKTNVPPEAELLHKRARQAGESGDYKKAIALLEKAANLAPQWPYPVYDTAFTYLLMKDTDNARKYYRKTVELSPRGFFTAITACGTLDRESRGELAPGTYLAYLSLEWIESPDKKADVVRQLVKQYPDLPPGWKELAAISDDDAEKLSAIEKGLAAHPDAETKGILLINKALVLERKRDHEGAIQILGGLVLDPASTYATEHLAKVTLANIASN